MARWIYPRRAKTYSEIAAHRIAGGAIRARLVRLVAARARTAAARAAADALRLLRVGVGLGLSELGFEGLLGRFVLGVRQRVLELVLLPLRGVDVGLELLHLRLVLLHF